MRVQVSDSVIAVTALIDTGAARTLIRQDVALSVLKDIGRPPLFKRNNDYVISMTGNQVNILGSIELSIVDVGIINFLVVDKMLHEMIIGYDSLMKFGFNLTDKVLVWGKCTFEICSRLQLDCNVDVVVNLPAIQIRMEPGKVVNNL